MKRIAIAQIGIGTVGGEVIMQALANRERWRRDFGLDIAIAAVIGRDGAAVARSDDALPSHVLPRIVDERRAGRRLIEVAEANDLQIAAPSDAIGRLAIEGATIVVDAAAGEETAALDAHALSLGAGVVLSNKAPLAMPAADPRSRALWAATGPGGRLRYEATCGAGLPVISTLRSLLDTGDEVLEITGALSGTLGAIFSDLAAGAPFSVAVRTAKERGYTEPDPRDDLSGLDVARKALILARTIGRRLDLSDVEIESLVPEQLRPVDVEEFMRRCGEEYEALAERDAAAQATGKVLKYVADVMPDGPIAVGVRAVPTDRVLGAVQGPENVIAIRSRRYDAYPLTVTGPGAGAAVTAAGMLADVLALATGPLARREAP